jgi:hypothetical protein
MKPRLACEEKHDATAQFGKGMWKRVARWVVSEAGRREGTWGDPGVHEPTGRRQQRGVERSRQRRDNFTKGQHTKVITTRQYKRRQKNI